jgi:hypothetical protein
MVNIPFKLPKLMIDDIEQFLKEYFLDKEYPDNTQDSTNKQDSKNTIKKEILNIFTKSIPQVPRKLIRVADLFKTKRKLASELSLNLDDKILAKFVILELLAPEIYRYGVGEFDGFYHRLSIWKDECGHLFNIKYIKENIENSQIAENEKNKHLKLLRLLENLRDKRGHFEINNVIEKLRYEDYEIYLTFAKPKEIVYNDELKEHTVSNEELFIQNILNGDSQTVSSAFRDEKFKLGQDKIQSSIIEKLLEEKEKLSYERFMLIKDYLGNGDFLKLISPSQQTKYESKQ